MENDKISIKGYSERGIINALFFELLSKGRNGIDILNKILEEVKFVNGKLPKIESVEILIEPSLSDFGDADVVLLCISPNSEFFTVFIEAKVKCDQNWSLSKQLESFCKPINYPNDRKLNSSNLFTQILHKLVFATIADIKMLEKGINFGNISAKIIRKIGKNKTVVRFVELIKKHATLENTYFVAITPEISMHVIEEFVSTIPKFISLSKAGFNIEENSLNHIGIVGWNSIENISTQLKTTKANFDFNKGQIY